ncbi:MAG: SIMPL domain-containing protein [Pseudomonadota bacterium]
MRAFRPYRCLFAVAVLALAALPAGADEKKPLATISVSGTGQVAGVPDEAVISAGVTTEDRNAADALSANAEAMRAVLAALQASGVAERDIATTAISLRPDYARSNSVDREPRIKGYLASNRVSVRVRALEDLGRLLDALGRAGATDIGAVLLRIAEPGPLEDEARRLAVADAKRKAALYAEAAGVELGRLLSISEPGVIHSPQPRFERMAPAMAAESAVPVAAGEQMIGARIQLVYEID